MKRILLSICLAAMALAEAGAALTTGKEYYIWLNIYEKLLGSNEAGDGPQLSAYGTNSDGYVFVAESSGKSGYVLLKQKSSGKYLAASSSNSWSVTLESKSTDDRFCWKADEGCYSYLVNKKNSKYLGIDGAQKGSTYVSVYYDKPKGSHSQFSIIPATGSSWDDARHAYKSAAYTNAQGVKEVDYCQLKDQNLDYSEAIDIHITSNDKPMTSSTVNLGSDRTWLIFDNILPSDVLKNYLDYITINGSAAVKDENCRVAIYLNGAAVIPLPEVVMECDGTAGSFTLEVGNHSNLKEYGNTMTSFTLRRGYMATLASGTNGSGHSRVYVADHKDLTVTLPQALDRRVSSVIVKKWQYVSKKGWGNTAGQSGGPGLRATWYWAWNADYWSTSDMEYVPCQQHRWWPSTSDVNSHASSATLSLNEPEHSEQHTSDKCSCGGTIDAWTAYGHNAGFQASGARIGSPQPTDLSYLTKYFGYVDENNNHSRCDFAVTHAYWDLGDRDATSYANWFCNTQCQSVWTNTGRPVWLTELEISASWNTNKIGSYNDNAKYLQVLLQKIDECPWIERYAIYSFDMWQTYMYYEANPSKGLTPAGQIYRDHRATFAYDSKYTRTPAWWAPGVKKPEIKADYDTHSCVATFTVKNPNSDMTDHLTVEMSTDGSTWSTVTELSDRSMLDDETLVLEAVMSDVPMGAKFRVSLTTLNGSSSESDTFEMGSLVNGSIVANSKSDVPGWTCVRAAANGYTKAESGDTYFEVWDSSPNYMSFDYYQNVSGLRNGVYRLSAKVFNSSNGVSGASVNDAVGLYAQTYRAMWFAPVTKDSEIDAADVLSLDNIVVTDGTLRVGVRNMKPMTARWAGADDFKLEYLGIPTEVLGMSSDNAIQAAIDDFTKKMEVAEDDAYDLSFLIHNPDGKNSDTGWKFNDVGNTSGEAYDGQNSDPKNTYFDRWHSEAYTSTMEQEIKNLPAGYYVLSAILRSQASISMKLSATNGDDSKEQTFVGSGATGGLADKGWSVVKLDAVNISDGQSLTIKLECNGTGWWSADHFTLSWTAPETPTSTAVTLMKDITTFAYDMPLDFTSPISGLKAYIVSSVDGDKAMLQEVTGAVPAGEGLILMGSQYDTFEIPYAAAKPAAVSNMLKGVLKDTKIGGDGLDYVLYDGAFAKAGAGTLKAGKAYLKLDAALGRDIIKIGDVTTGISEKITVNSGTPATVVYNLNGQRVSKPSKGIYVLDGKKAIKQ